MVRQDSSLIFVAVRTLETMLPKETRFYPNVGIKVLQGDTFFKAETLKTAILNKNTYCA